MTRVTVPHGKALGRGHTERSRAQGPETLAAPAAAPVAVPAARPPPRKPAERAPEALQAVQAQAPAATSAGALVFTQKARALSLRLSACLETVFRGID
jgi:hypothetical protein